MGMAGLFILVFFVLVAIFAPLLASQLRPVTDVPSGRTRSTRPPRAQFPFGTDNLGRSVLTLTIWGTRISLLVGLVATVLTVLLGTSIGIARRATTAAGGSRR